MAENAADEAAAVAAAASAKPVPERGRARPGDRPLVIVEREQQFICCLRLHGRASKVRGSIAAASFLPG
jgi:hypothetical protein